MANTITTGAGVYLTDFTGGQGIAPVTDYAAYATDLDVNFVTLKATVNALVGEVKAIAGPNALLGQDVMLTDDLTILSPAVVSGRIGINPVTVTINGGLPANLDISAGPMLLLQTRVDIVSQLAPGAGLGGSPVDPVYVGMDINGFVSVSNLPQVQVLDIATAVWNGTIFTSVTDALETFLDGDEWYQMRTEPADTPFVAGQYRGPHSRLDNIVKALGGFSLSTDGDAIGAQIIGGGSAANPRIGLATGADPPVIDANAGLYRSGASQLSFSTSSTERVRFSAEGIGAVPDGSPTAPSIALLGSVDLGFYLHAANEIGFTCNGNAAMMLRQTNLRAAIAGSAAQPFYTCDLANRDDSGMYFPAADSLAFATAGVEAVLIDPQGNLNLPTQSRVKGTKTTSQTMLDGTATNVRFTEADVDEVGAWHTPGDNTAGEEFTVPAGADGTYLLTMNFEWAGPATNGRDHFQEITVENVAVAKSQRETVTGEVYEDTVTGYAVLAAGEVVRARVTQTDNVGSLSLGIESASIAIVKVA
jgi:hypothetical protein